MRRREVITLVGAAAAWSIRGARAEASDTVCQVSPLGRASGEVMPLTQCPRVGYYPDQLASSDYQVRRAQSIRENRYHLEGRLLEVCDCRVLCPCWIGEDPDNGTCDSVLAYHFDAGMIDGVDVTGRTLALVSHIPGNVVASNFRVAVYLDGGASAAQEKALLDVHTGKLGGPIADFAKLVGEVVSVERTPITFDVQGGRGKFQVGEVSYAELEPYKGPDGSTTVLSNTIFSTVPGAPVFVGKATRYRSKHAKLGHDLDMTGHNALQSTFVFDA